MGQSINEVRDFWENNPLFSGESEFEPGSLEFFKEHKRVYYDDVFAGKFPSDLLIPKLNEADRALDLGCGVGFWVIELKNRLPQVELYAGDLTQNAIKITQKRLDQYKLKANLSIQNAEALEYEDSTFNHINCQGVIHHTPNTEACVKEIARVLKPGGTAFLSVYYKNIFIRNWNLLRPVGKMLFSLGARLKGRGRESIFAQNDVNEITRLYDGDKNPIGKCYSKKEFIEMCSPYFEVEKVFLNFFPARSLPFPIPKTIHSWLSRRMGFMIHLNLKKKG